MGLSDNFGFKPVAGEGAARCSGQAIGVVGFAGVFGARQKPSVDPLVNGPDTDAAGLCGCRHLARDSVDGVFEYIHGAVSK